MAGAGTLLRLPWLLISDVNFGGVDSRAKVEVLKLEDEWARGESLRMCEQHHCRNFFRLRGWAITGIESIIDVGK
jgi:hypothetical protein